jgi:hypothetical protein
MISPYFSDVFVISSKVCPSSGYRFGEYPHDLS